MKHLGFILVLAVVNSVAELYHREFSVMHCGDPNEKKV